MTIAVLGRQDLLLERSSRTLQLLAKLDAREAERHRANALLWQASYCSWPS